MSSSKLGYIADGDVDMAVAVSALSDVDCDKLGLNFAWGSYGQLYLHAASPVPVTKRMATLKLSENTRIHCLSFTSPTTYNEIGRKLANQLRNVFVGVQKVFAVDRTKPQSSQPHEPTFNKNNQLVKFSRNYRSVIQACLLEVHETQQQVKKGQDDFDVAEGQIELYTVAELVWSLCEMLFIEQPSSALLMGRLLEWTRQHCSAVDVIAREVCTSGVVLHKHESYWSLVHGLVLQGRVAEARNLLRPFRDRADDGGGGMTDRNQEAYATIDTLMAHMPNMDTVTISSVTEFTVRWSRWQDDCSRCLLGDEVAGLPHLETICRIFCGDAAVFAELSDLFDSFFELMVAQLLYTKPIVSAFELQYHTKDAIRILGGISELSPLDGIMLAVLEFDVHQVIKASGSHVGFWFAAHFADLLHHSGQLETCNVNVTDSSENLRDFLLGEYAGTLMSHGSMWQLGVDYLNHRGDGLLEVYLERVPLTTDRKAQKVLRVCDRHGLVDLATGVCRQMGMRAVRNRDFGSALSWALRSKNAAFVSSVADLFLVEYTHSGGFACADVLDNLGASMLLSDRLTFLGKYREFHALYGAREFVRAADLLLSLLTSRVAPFKLWPMLLMDSLPLLEQERVIFHSSQTYELMQCLLEISDRNQSPTPPTLLPFTADTSSQGGLEESEIQLISLALTRNLARALIEETEQ